MARQLTHLGIRLYLKPAATQVTLAPKGVYGGREVVADLLLLGVVPDVHPNVIVACATIGIGWSA